MNPRLFLAVTLSVLLISIPIYSEPVSDLLIGKINIQNPAKLDSRTKKELNAIAAKILKSRKKGTVKLKGDVPSAESEEEYISKAAFMARNVEIQLKTLLSGRYQVFITASKYSGAKRSGQNSVEITLYPRELKVEVDGFTSSQITSKELPPKLAPVYEQPVQPVYQQKAQPGLLTPPQDADDPVSPTSRKERVKIETENPALANELVIRAKARAAEKAKRLQVLN
jgi:hypothetical protein